ncbi:hypothetical protein [Holophaga foetida]|uniref:hypothetical protein n=1 Tax=Holophaga foetida TaxID=35839 RepID=UPI00024742C2|nr:hypothetical protein [Holophaga foetida]
MTKPLAPHASRSHRPGLWLPALALVLAAPGCYHATGIQRSTPVAEEIPSTGGDRVPGLKSAAGPGDYFLGNDAVSMAVDGIPYGGSGVPIAGALSGGSIVDAGYVALNTSYKRTSMPSDLVERLTPVVNQDPNLQMVFDTFTVSNSGSSSSLVMTGGICNVSTGVRMDGVAVTHTISLGETDRFFLLETTVTNNTGSVVAIKNIGDYLLQKGGGYRFNIPATAKNADGTALSTWGVEIPGTTDFSILNSVRAPMVGLMGVEPAAPTYDAHTSLGFLPVDDDEDYLLVSCPEAQNSLSDTRPKFPSALVVGKPALSTDSGLANGASLTYRRRLYAEGGSSLVGAAATKYYAYNYPNQATGIFNRMTKDRATLRGTGAGWVAFQTSGSAVRYGGAPTEIRIEDLSGNLVRTEWLEPQECLSTTLATNPRLWFFLPVGTYRIKLQSQQPNQWSPADYSMTSFASTFTSFSNSNDEDYPEVKVPLLVQDDPNDGDREESSTSDFIISNAVLCSEYDWIVSSGSQSVTDTAFPSVSLYAIERNAPEGHLQPLRWTIQGNSVPDPDMRRTRSLGSIYDTSTKAKGISGANYGCYAFGEGNQAFGTGFKSDAPFVASLIKGDYTLFATRGPLSLLQSRDITVSTTSTNSYTFIIFPATLPTGWTTFDMPGPSMASTGGLLPAEKLSGALAEGIQVVANTEEDLLTDSTDLRDEFRMEFTDDDVSDEQRTAVGDDPFVVPARSSDLSGMAVGNYGVATALFTPDPTTARNRGARLPNNWTLADFIKQAEGSYQVINRPRGPKGLFAAQNPSSAVKITDAWLSGVGTYSFGTRNGDFDAIELISAQAMSDLGSVTAWFTEFKAVRADWFSLLNGQTPASFTKALGLSSSAYTKDTPVGLGRTYLKTAAYSTSNTSGFTQDNLVPIQDALQAGAAVASTGPFVDVSVGSVGLGGLVSGSGSTVQLTVTVMAGDWVPVDEIRIVVNGTVVTTHTFGPAPASYGWAQDTSDTRKWTHAFNVTLSGDSWIVLEGGVPLATTGAYAPSTYPAWNKIMKGIYPVAVTNPIFCDTDGLGYVAPGNN